LIWVFGHLQRVGGHILTLAVRRFYSGFYNLCSVLVQLLDDRPGRGGAAHVTADDRRNVVLFVSITPQSWMEFHSAA
jgi:hypothetical protein